MSDSMQQRVPYAVSPPRYSVSHQMVTTAFELPNYRVVQNLGVVRGIVVRSRNIFATIGACLQTIVGGNITVWTTLCEQTRTRCFRDHDSTRDGDRRERDHRRALRHDRALTRRHGSSRVRHGRHC